MEPERQVGGPDPVRAPDRAGPAHAPAAQGLVALSGRMGPDQILKAPERARTERTPAAQGLTALGGAWGRTRI